MSEFKNRKVEVEFFSFLNKFDIASSRFLPHAFSLFSTFNLTFVDVNGDAKNPRSRTREFRRWRGGDRLPRGSSGAPRGRRRP